MSIFNTIKTYFILTKPRLWSLLVYAGIAGYLISSGGKIDLTLLILFISLL
ncbi:protoheme IX farnesyltransferase, partial [Candidatus Geothermarchaeota archaeon]